MRLIGMMTTWMDADWLPDALHTLRMLDGGVVCEGAYQETIKVGGPARSIDGTRELCKDFCGMNPGFHYIEANEASDKEQRNLVLARIKDFFGAPASPGDATVMMIIDGDEEYTREQIVEIREWAKWLCYSPYLCGILWSKVYNSDDHYILHAFPRLFRLSAGCRFVDDNYLTWPEKGATVLHSDKEHSRVKVLPYRLAAIHHSYQRGRERFEWKRAERLQKWGKFPWEWDEEAKRAVRVG